MNQTVKSQLEDWTTFERSSEQLVQPPQAFRTAVYIAFSFRLRYHGIRRVFQGVLAGVLRRGYFVKLASTYNFFFLATL